MSAPDSWSFELVDSWSLSGLEMGEAERDCFGDGTDLALVLRFLVVDLVVFFSEETVSVFRFLAGSFFRTVDSSLNNH